MLLKKHTLAAIKTGEITLVFRRWKRSTVKTGGTLKTAIGVLAIDRVVITNVKEITEGDARSAGYNSKAELLEEIDDRDGTLYRIELRYLGADPRIALRENDRLSKVDYESIFARLKRFDAFSRNGPWTQQVLLAIRQHPKRAAAELAAQTGFEKEWLKTNIRKLKNMGLTISHHPGYELSPRGKAFLDYIGKV